ncbi:MAG: site-2 protease family protein, partial [Anaerolineales bacterium]
MLNFSLAEIISLIVVLLIAFPIHELAHAVSADYFGDDTPRLHGRLTFNPLAHLDVFGSLTLILLGFGWAKPVPVNEYTLASRSRFAPALVALAG